MRDLFGDELDDPRMVTLEEVDERLDNIQMDNEDLAGRLKHIEQAVVVCIILLLFITALELQLFTVLELQQKWQQIWKWLQTFVNANPS